MNVSLLNILFRSAGPQTIPSQTYDYAALNVFALAPQLGAVHDNMQGSITENQTNVGDEDHGNTSFESDPEDDGLGEEEEEEEEEENNKNGGTPEHNKDVNNVEPL